MRPVIAIAAFLLACCGARTGVGVDEQGTGEAARDAGPPGASCLVDRDCDDGVDCTDDRCEAGRCVQTPLDALCDDGLFCNGQEQCVSSAG